MRPDIAAGLVPEVRERFMTWEFKVRERGYEMLTYEGRRSFEKQAQAYAIGRTKAGLPCRHKGVFYPVGRCPAHPLGLTITNAKPGDGAHQYGVAVDSVPTIGGKPDWSYLDVDHNHVPDEPWWRAAVEEAEKLGIEWAGRWTRFVEFVHWQVLGGKTIAQLRGEAGV